MKKLKCRFCPNEFDDFDALRFHVGDAHYAVFIRLIEPWLDEAKAKQVSLETLAQDGLHGFREQTTYKRTDESVDRF